MVEWSVARLLVHVSFFANVSYILLEQLNPLLLLLLLFVFLFSIAFLALEFGNNGTI
jgi:hypothetical protein